MKFRVWLKHNFADKALLELRRDMIELITANSSVLDLGCGTGDLLFQAATKISHGLGVDCDKAMIQFANNRLNDQSFANLSFSSENLKNLNSKNFDIATSTLCLHVMHTSEAYKTLDIMKAMSKRLLIADYSQPNTLGSKLGIELDEMVSGHYQRFRRYRKAGGIANYAQSCGLKINKQVSSSIDGITIWDMSASN